jgi:hypothetical protein
LSPLIIRESIEKLKEKYEKGDSSIEIVEKGENVENGCPPRIF